MDTQYRNYVVVAIAGVFCWLNAGVASAQTATDLNCSNCVNAGEVAPNSIAYGSLDANARNFLINQANTVQELGAEVDALEARVDAGAGQTATDLDCRFCVNPGEISFRAVGRPELSNSLQQSLQELEVGTIYHTSGNLNTVSLVAGSSFQKIDDFLIFTKQRDDTKIEVIVNSRATSGSFVGDTRGVQYEIRVDDLPAFEHNLIGAITTTNTIDFLPMMAVFEFLPAGSHTVSIWALATGGTSGGVLMDPGGWGGRVMTREIQ